MKKILFVINSLEGGGAERILSLIVNALDPECYDLAIHMTLRPAVCYRVPAEVRMYGPPDPHTSKVGGMVRLLLHGLAFVRFCYKLYKPGRYREAHAECFSQLSKIYLALVKLRKVVSKERPDLVVSFIPDSNIMVGMAKRFFRLTVPTCCSDHCSLLREYKHYNPLKYLIMPRIFYREYDMNIAVSRGLKTELVERYALDPAKVEVVHNGIDIEEIERRRSEPLPQELSVLSEKALFKIVTVGRLVPGKGQELILRALEVVSRQIDCRLFFLGEGPDRAHLVELSRELGVGERVVFLGWRPNPFSVVGSCDLLVSASLWDAFPNTLLEAMALGVPVVATDCPTGPREILKDGACGVLVPVNDVAQLAAAVLRLARDEAMRRHFAEKGRLRVQQFTMEKMIAGYEGVFRRLTEKESLFAE